MSSFAAVVRMVEVLSVSPSSDFQPSQSPAKAKGAPSCRAMA
jgi:hypothetical protein